MPVSSTRRGSAPVLVMFLIALPILTGCEPVNFETTDGQGIVVRFELDVSTVAGADETGGDYQAKIDSVGIRGGIQPLSWGESIHATAIEDDSLIYVAVVQFPQDSPEFVPYKIKIDGFNVPNDGWEEGVNRTVRLTADTVVVRRAFNDPPEDLPSTITGDVRVHEAFGSGRYVPPRDLFVWLPPGYGASGAMSYPVLYMHDGQNVFDVRAAGGEWRLDESATSLIEAGEIEPVIIVGIANTESRFEEYTPSRQQWRQTADRVGDLGESSGDPGESSSDSGESSGDPDEWTGRYRVSGLDDSVDTELRIRSAAAGYELLLPGEKEWVLATERKNDILFSKSSGIYLTPLSRAEGRIRRIRAWKDAVGGEGPSYARYLVEEVKPFIDRTYRTLPDRAHTAVGGSSLGGLVTLYIGAAYSDVFGGLLVVSPSIWWNGRDILDTLRSRGYADGQRIWLDMGTDEGENMLSAARGARGLLDSLGWAEPATLRYLEDAGAGHSEGAWAARAPDMLRYLYGLE